VSQGLDFWQVNAGFFGLIGFAGLNPVDPANPKNPVVARFVGLV
jgi:hypothetical protein